MLLLGIGLGGWSSAALATEDHVDGTMADELAAAVQHWLDTGLISDPGATGGMVDVQVPAMARLDLGLLVGPDQSGNRGLRVIGVRPGGWGQRLGIEVDDVILAVGPKGDAGLSVGNDAALSPGRLRERLLALGAGADVGLLVRRGGRSIELNSLSPVRELPAIRLVVGDADRGSASVNQESTVGCARISAFPAPPLQWGLHEATVLSIDGVSVPAGRHSRRVEPGFRTLVIGERIAASFLPGTTRRGGDREATREFSLWLEAGRTYLVGARLLPEATGRGQYWEPVVWRTVDEACR